MPYLKNCNKTNNIMQDNYYKRINLIKESNFISGKFNKNI